jgi:hypothetical protein
MGEYTEDDEGLEYVHATFKVARGFGVIPQIRNVMIHIDSYTEEELEGKSDEEILQMWVDAVLDNAIDNDWERLGEIGERP